MKKIIQLILIALSILVFSYEINAQENTATLCSDGIDNDNDGFIDCDDSECISLPNQGCSTCFSDGLSFADSVVYYNNTCPNNVATDSSRALGVSDHIAGSQGFVTLGNGGTLILEFKNNVLTNSGGTEADLWIFEIGNLVEATIVELKPKDENTLNILINEGVTDIDNDGYYDFGTVAGATSSVDIDNFFSLPYSPGSLLFSQVKLTDVPGSCSGNTPGADIDAVCALSSGSIDPQEVSAIDCSDGLDNDGDGLIDCDDTGCSSLPNEGCLTCQNDGVSFADTVKFYNNACPNNLYTNSSFALGVSDNSAEYTSFVSLGEGGVLILDFVNNILTNSGNTDSDLWVFEVGDFVESTTIELLPLDGATTSILINEGITDADMDGYYDFGSIQGSTRALDIDEFFTQTYGGGTLQFTSVKLTDVPSTCGGESSPGADIDAVCALSSISTLPIELTSFIVRENKSKDIHLLWQTNTEINNDHFIIERSQDGKNFENIGQVRGAGTTNIQQSYNFVDQNPFKNVSYYRLKQVDHNGKFSFSDIRSINLRGDQAELLIYPNPINDILFIESQETIISVRIYNNQGRVVLRSDVKDQRQYSLQNLPQGIYRVLVQTEDKVFMKNIIKS